MDSAYLSFSFLPDVGDVLDDPGLSDISEPITRRVIFEYKSGEEEAEEEEEEGILRNRVLYWHQSKYTFKSPPPTHIAVGWSATVDELESIKFWLHQNPSLTLLFPSVSDLSVLRNLPPHSHVHLGSYPPLEIVANVEALADALHRSACHVDLLVMRPSIAALDPQIASKLGGRCRALFLYLSSTDPSLVSGVLLSDLMSSPDCKLSELTLEEAFYDQLVKDPKERPKDHYVIGISRALNELGESCKLKRLDMRGLPAFGPEHMQLLVNTIAAPSCSIHDLGINLSDTSRDWQVNEPQRKASCFILAQAFQGGPFLSKLKALRLTINSSEAASCVVEILGSPQSNCKVRLLDITILKSCDGVYEPFFKKLLPQESRPGPRIECLRADFHFDFNSDQSVSELSGLCDFLSWEHCLLVWLHCSLGSSRVTELDESLQTRMANSLEANYPLCYLQITGLTSPSARARATAFLARNRLYKSMGLTKEECMKPQVARLFLCGHGEVGKTTLCKSILKVHSRLTHHRSFINKWLRPCRCVCSTKIREGLEARTRGLEIHQLCFQPAKQRLSIFDLGGQSDYHVFHHYFMSNTSHDLFIIVCKYNPSTLASQVLTELEYWLKFIVSHRNTVHGPNPKIILVINFFHVSQSLGMQARAEDLTKDLRDKYGADLNFSSVFGIVALDEMQAAKILADLERLLQDCLHHKPLIPRLCHDLSTNTLPQLVNPKKKFTCGIRSDAKVPARNLFVGFSQIEARYANQQGNQHQQTGKMLHRRMHAALKELHNTGEVIFFPPVKLKRAPRGAVGDAFNIVSKEQAEEGTVVVAQGSTSSSQTTNDVSPIITDPNWFCNKVIGNLLAPEVLSGRSVWTFLDVEQVLIEHGCPKQYLNEVLRYLHSLEFCFPFYNRSRQQWAYFFPAVTTDRTLQWPPMFTRQVSTIGGSDEESRSHFYGRRIKCKDTDRYLIPSGVFARLQVRLNEFCDVGSYQSYHLGYHWASFVTQRIGVMVRFGKVASSANVPDGNQASNTGPMCAQPQLSTRMKEDDHPEWIDILLCCPSTQLDAQQQSMVSAEVSSIMKGIKRIIYDICQATSRGIPTVALEERVLRHEAQKDGMPLADIQALISERGLACHVAWEDQESSPAADLLLPEELQEHVMKHFQAIQEIEDEFPRTIDEEKGELNAEVIEGDQLQGDFRLMGAKLDNLMILVKEVRQLVEEVKQDVHKIMARLQQAEMRIVANCSTRLLSQVLLQCVPAYPYLTDSEGKMQKLKSFLSRKTATIHFLCEDGPHEVQGQAGKEVVVEKGILMKVAPFLVPTLTVLCCIARCAANFYLPGVAPVIFSPLLDILKSIGITQEDLQSKIVPQALNALFDELDVQIQKLYDPKSRMLIVDEQQRRECVQALQEFLGKLPDIDMQKDFNLYLVQVGRESDGSVKARWFCKDHTKAHGKLRQPKNPFA